MAKAPGKPWKSKAGASKVQTVFKEYGKGQLHSGSPKGPVVRSHEQATAIAMSEARKAARGKK